MRVVIFTGPTISVEDAKRILPDAEYHPPARQSDFLSIVCQGKPDVIGLIDGEFSQSLSVWHKEILYALSQGIHVFGSSSMGAIRAAECWQYGMVPVGVIANGFAEGRINDDDAVALCHDGDFRKLSEPLCNICYTCAGMVSGNVITREQMSQIVTKAKSLFYPERTIKRICDGVVGWQKYLDNYVDIKKLDAVELLKTIADLPADLAPFSPPFKFQASNLFQGQMERDRTIERGGVKTSLCFVEGVSALRQGGQQDWRDAMNRALAIKLADMMEIDADVSEIQRECVSFIFQRKIADGELDAWLLENDISSDEFVSIMREQAVLHKLHNALKTTLISKRTTKIVLDQLRLNGKYPSCAEQAVRQEAAKPEYHDTRSLSDLLRGHHLKSGVEFSKDILDFIDKTGYENPHEVQIDLIRHLNEQ